MQGQKTRPEDEAREGEAREGSTISQCRPAAVSAALITYGETSRSQLAGRTRGIRMRHEPGTAERMRENVRLRQNDMPHILVVDDDPMVCMAIEVYLERHNFQVTVADGGEAGLRALDEGRFDLMIVDVFMPHMRGFESIRIFHERAPTVPLIAISGYAFADLDSPAPDFLKMTLDLGASRCLRKPFTPVALVAVINECLADARSARAGTAQLG